MRKIKFFSCGQKMQRTDMRIVSGPEQNENHGNE
jgi:hypothetical protein